jgi:hypothetical protein
MEYILSTYVTYVADQGIKAPFSSAYRKEHTLNFSTNLRLGCSPALHLWRAV